MDSSALIALQKIGQLDLLRELFGLITVPPAVAREVPSLPKFSWIERYSGPFPKLNFPADFGDGECDAISLGVHMAAKWVVLDDAVARQEALRMGLNVIGVVGILLVAKRQKVVVAIRPLLDQLLATNFHVSGAIVAAALKAAGE